METTLTIVVVLLATMLGLWYAGGALLRGAIAIASALNRRWRS